MCTCSVEGGALANRGSGAAAPLAPPSGPALVGARGHTQGVQEAMVGRTGRPAVMAVAGGEVRRKKMVVLGFTLWLDGLLLGEL
jgi:hypothetical protein